MKMRVRKNIFLLHESLIGIIYKKNPTYIGSYIAHIYRLLTMAMEIKHKISKYHLSSVERQLFRATVRLVPDQHATHITFSYFQSFWQATPKRGNHTHAYKKPGHIPHRERKIRFCLTCSLYLD